MVLARIEYPATEVVHYLSDLMVSEKGFKNKIKQGVINFQSQGIE